MDPARLVLLFTVLAIGLSAHESAHAYMADQCGDPTGRLQGRISMNPLDHIDPVGSILLPILLAAAGMVPFGYARPVPVNTSNLRRPRRDHAKVAAAGPGTNLLLALSSLVLTVVFWPFLRDQYLVAGDGIRRLLRANTRINAYLAVFNMLPVPPLDGGGVLQYYLDPRWSRWLEQNRQVLAFGLLALLLLGGVHYLLTPFVYVLLRLEHNLLLLFWGP